MGKYSGIHPFSYDNNSLEAVIKGVLLNKCFFDLQFIIKTYIQSLWKVPSKLSWVNCKVITIYRSSRLWLFICCKTKLKIFLLFLKNICVLYKIYIICRKNCFYMEKKFYIEKFFYWKKTFFGEKNVNEKVKNMYLIWKIYFYTENVCVANKI